MMWGPGVSRAAADLVLTGRTDVVDATILGLDRFDADGHSRLATDPIALPFPHVVQPASRHRRRVMTEEPIRSVLYGVQEAAGAHVHGGQRLVVDHDLRRRRGRVRRRAPRTPAMWDVYGLQKWDVSGPDAAAAVQRTFTGDVARLTVGQVKYGAVRRRGRR